MLALFRDQFWLDGHRWFVRCDRDLSFGRTIFYTLPYSFKDFSFPNTTISKWTSSQTKYQWSYDCVRNLTYEFFNGELSTHHIPFLNTQHFSPVLSVDIHCRYIVLKFDQLISLTAISAVPNEHCVIQLQSLLDRASHLSQLHTEWLWDRTLEKVLFEIESVSIYHLNLLFLIDGSIMKNVLNWVICP